MKRIILIVFGVVLVGSSVWAVAFARSGESRARHQVFTWTKTATSSTEDWTTIEGLEELFAFCPRGGGTATATLQLAPGSGPVEVRALMVPPDDPNPKLTPMRPGSYLLDAAPGGGQTSQVHTVNFVTKRIPGLHGSSISLQWRSASGVPTTLEKATLTVVWNPPNFCA